jgi:hypothetical protein
MRTARTLALVAMVVGFAGSVSAVEVDPLPEGLKGFRGMMIGTITYKAKDEFVLKVETITKTWKENQAENPKSAVGKRLAMDLREEGRLRETHLRTLAALKVGDRVLVEPFHFEGKNHLTVVEELRKEEACHLPEGMRGFRGMVRGTLVSKTETAFVLKVEKILKTWRGNKAEKPAVMVGREVPMELWPKSRLKEQHRKTLAALKPGDKVVCEPFHFGGNVLSVVEELRKDD